VTGDCQARFCERLGVQFPGPTRPSTESPRVPQVCSSSGSGRRSFSAPFHFSPRLIALKQPQSCAAATTATSNHGMLIAQHWDPAPELAEYPAEDLRPLDCVRSPKMIETTWRDFYRAAILEVDRSLLKVRLKAAEDSISARASDARASRQERREMADALWTLQRLKRVDRRLVPNGVESARELH
jgi:hypothetical protein